MWTRTQEPNEEQEHSDNQNMDLLLCGPCVQPAGAGGVAPMPVALCSAASPVHAWHEHHIYLVYLICGVEKTELDHCLPSSLPISKRGVQARC